MNGKAAAVLFAREGAKVLCADVNENAANETVEIIRQENGTANAICADVTSHDDIRRMVKACTDLYGRIDVVDYNVGLAHVGGVVELPEEEWDRIFAVNLKGCFLTMKHVIPIMEKQGGGSIINISSVAGIRYTGVPYSTYYATKAAMIHLTRTTAVQYAPKHIRVNTVLPGLMKTPMVEKTAGLAAEYGKGDIEEMWKVRDAQCPMGHMGDAWGGDSDHVFALCSFLGFQFAPRDPGSEEPAALQLRQGGSLSVARTTNRRAHQHSAHPCPLAGNPAGCRLDPRLACTIPALIPACQT